MKTGKVIPILSRQSTCLRWLWCRDCNHQFKIQLPVTMAPEQVECEGCWQTGFLVGQSK